MYLFYVDDSGEREYISRGRYFVLTALGVQGRDWKPLNKDMLTLKRAYFHEVRVEIKSNWLRIPAERRRRYLDPFGITEHDLREFTDNVYNALLAGRMWIWGQ